MASFFSRFSLPALLLVSVPVFAQTQTVSTTAGDQSAGSLGAAITAINGSGTGGAVSFVVSSGSVITLTQPLTVATQSITLSGNPVTLQNQSSGVTNIQILSTADFSTANGVTFNVVDIQASAGSNGGGAGVAGSPGNAGGNVAVTALTSSMGVSSKISMVAGFGGAGGTGGSGANGGDGGVGGNAGITIGTLTLNNNSYLDIEGGRGGIFGPGGSGGNPGNSAAGGSASASIGSLTTSAASTLYMRGGDGNGGGNSGGNAGSDTLNLGAVTMNGGTILLQGAYGGLGGPTGGNGGSITVTATSVTMASSSNILAYGGPGGGPGGNGGNVFVSMGSLALGTNDAFTANGGSAGAGGLGGNASVSMGSVTMAIGSSFTLTGAAPTAVLSQLNGFGTLSATGGTVQASGGTYSGTINTTIFRVPSGTFTLEGTATLPGGMVVSGGLVVGDSLAATAVLNATVTLTSSGTLAGFGTIHGLVTNSGAFVPESPTLVGSLNLTQFTQTSGGVSRFLLHPGANQTDSLMVVSGTQLAGAVSLYNNLGENLGFRDRYTLISGGPVTGTFTSVGNAISGMTPYMYYGSNAVSLIMLQSGVDFTAFAKTPNQTAVATVLNAVLLTCGDSFSVKEGEVFNLPSGQSSILDQLSGVIYTSLPHVMLDNLQFEDDLLFSRLGGNAQPGMPGVQASLAGGFFSADVTVPLDAPAKPGSTLSNGLWLENADSFGSVNATTNVLGFNKSNVGFLGGYDMDLSPDLKGGVMGGYMHTALTQSDSTAQAGIDGIQFGLYGNKRMGDMDLGAVAGYVVDHFKVDRTITLGSDVNQMEGAYDGSQIMGALQFDYRLVDVDTTILPFLGLQYAHLSENAFTESGSSTLNLSVPAQSYDSLRPYLGLGETWSLSLGRGLQLVPGVKASVSEEVMNTSSQFQTAFGGASSNSFTVAGITPDSTEFSIGGGVDFLAGKQFSLFASYNGRFSGSQNLNTVSGGLNLTF